MVDKRIHIWPNIDSGKALRCTLEADLGELLPGQGQTVNRMYSTNPAAKGPPLRPISISHKVPETVGDACQID